jgi:hypothetical protein
MHYKGRENDIKAAIMCVMVLVILVIKVLGWR